MRFNGVFVAAVTPFDEKNQVDLTKLNLLLNHWADQGAHGFVPCGTTGESPTLTANERRDVIKCAATVSKERKLKVIANCGTYDTQASINNVREAKELGCNGALVVTPYYSKPTQPGLIKHFVEVAEKGDLPIVLYHIPGRTGISMSVDTVVELSKHPNIVGVKDATASFSHWLNVASKVDLDSFGLMAGDDDALAPILALGGSGIISASANVVTPQMVAIYDAAKEGALDRSFDLQKKLAPLIEVMFCESNPIPVKYALSQLGQCLSAVRLPLVEATLTAQEKVKTVLSELEIHS